MTNKVVESILNMQLGIHSRLVIADSRDGFASGVHVHAAELEALTGVDACEIAQMAREVVAIQHGVDPL